MCQPGEVGACVALLINKQLERRENFPSISAAPAYDAGMDFKRVSVSGPRLFVFCQPRMLLNIEHLKGIFLAIPLILPLLLLENE